MPPTRPGGQCPTQHTQHAQHAHAITHIATGVLLVAATPRVVYKHNGVQQQGVVGLKQETLNHSDGWCAEHYGPWMPTVSGRCVRGYSWFSARHEVDVRSTLQADASVCYTLHYMFHLQALRTLCCDQSHCIAMQRQDSTLP